MSDYPTCPTCFSNENIVIERNFFWIAYCAECADEDTPVGSAVGYSDALAALRDEFNWITEEAMWDASSRWGAAAGFAVGCGWTPEPARLYQLFV